MADFETALKSGQKFEDIVLKQINKKYPNAKRIEGYFKGGDIYVPDINKYIEVKADLKSEYTGNTVVEIEFNGKPSALSTTESWYWVFCDELFTAWIFPDMIWKCIIENKLKPAVFIGKGDVVSKKAYLIPRRLLYSYSDKLIQYTNPKFSK